MQEATSLEALGLRPLVFKGFVQVHVKGWQANLLEAAAGHSHDAGLLQQLLAVEEVRRLARLLGRLRARSPEPHIQSLFDKSQHFKEQRVTAGAWLLGSMQEKGWLLECDCMFPSSQRWPWA